MTPHEIQASLRANMGEVDHRRVCAPYIRLVSEIIGRASDATLVYDLRFTQPNKGIMGTAAVHSLEHLLHVFLAHRLAGFVNIGPMGCRTGFYLVLVNQLDFEAITACVTAALTDILSATEVPLANVCQCGNAMDHDLDGAKFYAQMMLAATDEWLQVYPQTNTN